MTTHPRPGTLENERMMRNIVEIDDWFSNLNNKYGLALSYSRPGEAEMLVRHLLEKSHEFLTDLKDALKLVDAKKIKPRGARTGFERMKEDVETKISRWFASCAASLETNYPNDDLGIQAKGIAFEAKLGVMHLVAGE